MTTDATSITSLYASTSLDGGGFSPFAGIIIEPFEGTQFYVNYSNAVRSPSIIESVSAFTMEVNSALRPERSSDWEIGTNLRLPTTPPTRCRPNIRSA